MHTYRTTYRTHHCGELRITDLGLSITLCGWVQTIRDKGEIIFIDLRDRYGITQLYLEKSSLPALFSKVRTLNPESVLRVLGTVQERRAKNPKLPTGDIEVVPQTIEVLNSAATLPFTLFHPNAREELRMQHRYLDLRRPEVQKKLVLRHQIAQAIRCFLNDHDFMEVETPMLIKSTPEGARDFIVPSRKYPKQYYALPQSPQLLKQTLMAAGIDRYYQLARCLRDEDLRSDRQPEFTQVDLEASFVTAQDVMSLTEGMIQYIWKRVAGVTLPAFPRITYQQAIELYGSDKPDLRWNMPFINLTLEAKKRDFVLFDSAEIVLGIRIVAGAKYSRKQLDKLQSYIKENHAEVSNLVYIKYKEEKTITSSVDKFYSKHDLQEWLLKAQAIPNDLLLIVGGSPKATRVALADLRRHVVDVLDLPAQKTYAPLWVTNFPLFEEINGELYAMHHPFTSPDTEGLKLLATQPTQVTAQAYDLVMNGQELGSGSIRIHERSLQEKVLGLLGFDQATIEDRFGFLLQAFDYGAPPHGGIALGLARMCALIDGGEAIRDYIAFPKNNHGRDPMMGAPSHI